MHEYIRREAALDAQNKSMNLAECRKRLERLPAADVVEVRHGMWGIFESCKRKSVCRCSECGNFLTVRPDTLNGGRGDMNYCPNCGAKMDGDTEEDEEETPAGPYDLLYEEGGENLR